VEYWNPKIETMPLRELGKYQTKLLKQIVRYSFQKSPLYQRKFKKAGVKPEQITSLDDVAKLPFTEKNELRNAYPFGFSAVPADRLARVYSSTGTTGRKTTLCLMTPNDLELWSDLMARCLVCATVKEDDRIHLAFGFERLNDGGHGFMYGADKLKALSIPIGFDKPERQIQIMKDIKPTVLCMVPSYALYVAETAKKLGIDLAKELNFRLGIFGAEGWAESLRKRFESTFGLEAYDEYGPSELWGPGVSIECHEHDGLHVWSDYYLVEVIDPKTGELVGDKEQGELVFTTLRREALPLVRYRTGDIAMLDSDVCACGRTHPRMSKVLGRWDDEIRVSGKALFPLWIEDVLMSMDFIGSHYQIVKPKEGSMNKLKIRVEASEEAKKLAELKAKVEEKLADAFSVPAEVDILPSGSLPRSSITLFFGKERHVVLE
jgi:phenylacetate-CoA ligase